MVSNPAVQHAISPEEWALRQDLAACCRRDGTSPKPSTFCACKIQVDVMASGAKQIIPSRDAIASVEQYSLIGKAGADDPDSYLQRNWQALIRMLDREDPSFRE